MAVFGRILPKTLPAFSPGDLRSSEMHKFGIFVTLSGRICHARRSRFI
jgi:hypothetical protein